MSPCLNRAYLEQLSQFQGKKKGTDADLPENPLIVLLVKDQYSLSVTDIIYLSLIPGCTWP